MPILKAPSWEGLARCKGCLKVSEHQYIVINSGTPDLRLLKICQSQGCGFIEHIPMVVTDRKPKPSFFRKLWNRLRIFK